MFYKYRLNATWVYLFMELASALFLCLVFTTNSLYEVTVAGLAPLQLVLVGTALEVSTFLFEVPTGIVADVYSRRLSIVIGYLLIGAGLLVEGYFPSFWPILLSSVIWGSSRPTPGPRSLGACAEHAPEHRATRADHPAGCRGLFNRQIARKLDTSRPSVILWRERFKQGGTTALTEVQPGRGRKPTLSAKKVKQIVDATLHTTPKAATHWSCRTMAEAQGVSPATVQRIWDAHGLQPHRVRTFKLSRDPQFVDKLTDVVGLYLNPPDKAVVLCVDEKSQIQALDRTQPGLPMKKGRCGTMTHDYKRNGTTRLFAALNLLEGKVIGQCLPRHRHQEFLKFLRRLDREFPRDLDLHLIVDNYGTHKHEDVARWLRKHRRFHLHFIPTGSSWLNLVERWFRELTGKRIRRGSFYSVKDLIHAIEEYLQTYNETPRPFVWTASVETILRKLRRCKAVYETLH